ncbi:MAG: AMP-binding protein [Clostridiales bacterium]|nr:AMP-binding protein [Clostridiales bacterium]
MKNILQYLEKSAALHPEKIIFADADTSVRYESFIRKAMAVGTAIASPRGERNRPIAVMMPRSVENLIAMMGVVYSGNFYVVIDSEMPRARVEKIFQTLCPAAVLLPEEWKEERQQWAPEIPFFTYEACADTSIDSALLENIRRTMVDTDPLYALFTSGSTGTPKGAVLSHRNVIAYSKWFTEAFGISEKTVFANQTPFYFSMSVSDIYATLRAGATLHIIPKSLFSFPVKLIEFLNARMVNTIYWVPSALCIVANWKVLDYAMPDFLEKVLFAGEVMPVRQLNYWMEKLPDAMFANLFGPTETTDICTYYIVKKTAAAFVQNPLQSAYPELVYKTGDLVRENERGELLYISRKDFQIKHMGYRIELSEIEAAAGAIPQITACAAVYDKEHDRILLVYQGSRLEAGELYQALAKRLPAYMLPSKCIRVKAMPYNQNGKIDRTWLRENLSTLGRTPAAVS